MFRFRPDVDRAFIDVLLSEGFAKTISAGSGQRILRDLLHAMRNLRH